MHLVKDTQSCDLENQESHTWPALRDSMGKQLRSHEADLSGWNNGFRVRQLILDDRAQEPKDPLEEFAGPSANSALLAMIAPC